jgi:hypothetical protein
MLLGVARRRLPAPEGPSLAFPGLKLLLLLEWDAGLPCKPYSPTPARWPALMVAHHEKFIVLVRVNS